MVKGMHECQHTYFSIYYMLEQGGSQVNKFEHVCKGGGSLYGEVKCVIVNGHPYKQTASHPARQD